MASIGKQAISLANPVGHTCACDSARGDRGWNSTGDCSQGVLEWRFNDRQNLQYRRRILVNNLRHLSVRGVLIQGANLAC
jgi:hypothetical protein